MNQSDTMNVGVVGDKLYDIEYQNEDIQQLADEELEQKIDKLNKEKEKRMKESLNG